MMSSVRKLLAGDLLIWSTSKQIIQLLKSPLNTGHCLSFLEFLECLLFTIGFTLAKGLGLDGINTEFFKVFETEDQTHGCQNLSNHNFITGRYNSNLHAFIVFKCGLDRGIKHTLKRSL